ncbi:cyclic nucleotide-binding domain-containing protein [Candidatus Fermentibacteria bacterium]|nr:cyclic nucleotide-binding domain-containing protein [Candidatus Fermentibacteria bacterium]
MNTSEVFRDFRPLDSGNFQSFCELRKVSAGEILVRQGEASSEFHVVLSGNLRVVDQRTGEDFFLARLLPGDVFGEMSFLDGSPRSATVVAESDSDVLTMTRSGFCLLMTANPHLGTLVLIYLGRMMAGRLRVTDEKIASMAHERDNRELSELRRLISGIRVSARNTADGPDSAGLL